MAIIRKFAESERTLHARFACKASRTNGIPISGDAVVLGQLPGVALTGADSNNEVTAQLDGVFTLEVSGVNQSGNSAVLGGDRIYFTAGDAIPLSKKNTGVPFGYAIGAHNVELIASGSSGSIDVKVGA